MFQTFEVTSDPGQGPARLAALRAAMAAEGLDAFIVPRADAYQGEYVAPCDARLAWLTGFTGSAGFCAVTASEAGVFVDGRYRLQVKDQVAPGVFTPVDWPEVKLADWLAARLQKGAVVGIDPWLHTLDEVAALAKVLTPAGINLREVGNLVDPLWTDRPTSGTAPFTAYPLELAGETATAKRARLAEDLKAAGHRAAVLTLPDSIAWLLNIRGHDLPHNPVPQSFAILHDDGRCALFAPPEKAAGLAAHLGPEVTLHGQDGFLKAVAALEGPVRVDPKSAPQILSGILGDRLVKGEDPCVMPKALKNPTEIAGARAAHLRDGAAMVRFLAWLDAEAPKGGLTEIAVVTELERFRRATNALQDISFETICGAGPHGAIVHYRVSTATDRPVKPGELLLVDSGGQYLDGTTDITRTVIVGDAAPDHIACYTRVLQGMIAVSRARFPRGVGGQHLDALARFPLWTAGLDYDHGTGHGIGAYLSVHEGPQRISRTSDVALQAGMMLSNEPGYYRAGAFGIRIENLLVVRDAPALPGGDDRKMLDFETLTFVPLDRRLIDKAVLARAERDWIDAYHAATLAAIGPLVDGAAKDWLIAACAPL
ncbi:MAG: M24 family metallopeptidase [Limimaricola sp.]|uniref:aminopeptidase P family protein n=1 Tax=Limimaricola sp. TaxID=2211665 RepID=UPI001D4D8AAA|nr:aminopeptidase P family protein [Limimaricola sp.]MBI1418561.1 M24 family metallopeptidase [Limimaricola sp.]